MIGIGGGGAGMGPRGMLRSFGDHEETTVKSHVILRLLSYLKPYRLRISAAIGLMIVTTGAGLAIPFITRYLIDVHIVGGNMRGLLTDGAWLAASMVAAYLAQAGQSYLLSRTGQDVLYNLRNELFSHLQRLSVAYNDSHISGVTVSRVINDVSVINNLLSEGLVTMIGDSLLIVGTVVAMMLMEVKLALVTFTIVPVMILATYLFSKRARVAFRETREKVAVLVGNLAENIGGMRVIQSYAQEEESQKRFESNNWENRNANVKAMSLSFIFLPTIDVLGIAATCIVLLAGGLMSSGGAVTIGIIVAFMTYVNRFFVPIRELSQLFTTLQSASAGGERVLQILDSKPVVSDSSDAIDIPAIRGEIEFDRVSFSYVPGTEVLHHVSFSIAAGQTAAVVGPTGAGKSTIINLVCRFYEPDSGSVKIDGRDVRTITSASIHRQMGYVSQDPFLFSGTIAENICFGLDETNREAMIDAAQRAEAHQFIERLADGYETKVLEGGVNLSTGQRQLISIARAILVDPAILIMDEATSSVDTVTEGLIQRALDYLLSGRTAIVIAHRLTTVRGADNIFVLDDGRIVEEGNHEELVSFGGIYANLYDKQFIDR